MLSRKQYVEYKLKLAQRPGATSGSDALSQAGRAELSQELQELANSIDNATRQYEIRFSERFVRPPSLVPAAGSGSGTASNSISPGLLSPGLGANRSALDNAMQGMTPSSSSIGASGRTPIKR